LSVRAYPWVQSAAQGIHCTLGVWCLVFSVRAGKVDVRLPRKENSNSHGARPVHLIITIIKWTRTSRLSINNSLSLWGGAHVSDVWCLQGYLAHKKQPPP